MKKKPTYRELQRTLAELKEKGFTTIGLNKNYETLAAELTRIILENAHQPSLELETSDEPEPINPLKTDTDETEDDEPKASIIRPNKPKPGSGGVRLRVITNRHHSTVPASRLGAKLSQLVPGGASA